MPKATTKEVISFIKKENIEIVDLKFVDLRGVWQHASIPGSLVDDSFFEKGIGFDGSSIKGFQQIHESDMILMPDPQTYCLDPFCQVKTLSIICNVYDPEKREFFTRDPRFIAQKAEKFLKKSRIGSDSYWGPELEFFLFDNFSFDINPYSSGYNLGSSEVGTYRSFEDNRNTLIPIRPKEGYFPVSPQDTLQDIRSEMVGILRKWGIQVEMHHHEVAASGQCEIDMRYASLLEMADNVMKYKYIVKNTAFNHSKIAIFMPKPVFGDNGSGMHTHQSIWKNGKNIFYERKGYAELSETALYYIGGLLTHIDSLLAFCAPTTNSYRRLVPHYEAPVNVAFSKRNRSAAVRIPMYFSGPENSNSKRIEFRPPDVSSNPYLAFSAMLMAGIDGIKRKIDPKKKGFGPIDKNTYELPQNEASRIKSVPGSLTETLDALEKDHAFLLDGGVFTKDLIETWVGMKRIEIQEIALRPVPYEFYLYSDL